MVIGIMGAIAQSEIKRLLYFNLVSHIGYMIFGIALATQASLGGAIFYTAHHITVQAALFLVAGLIERVGGSTSMDRLGGLASTAPVLGALFFVPAMNLAGIPPLSGFVGKLGLLMSGVEVGTPLAWALVGGSVLTSLLTLYAVAKVWNRAFWGTPVLGPQAPDEFTLDDDSRAGRMPGVMVGATAALVGLGLALTFLAGPLYEYVDRAAASVLGSSYLEAVLSGVAR